MVKFIETANSITVDIDDKTFGFIERASGKFCPSRGWPLLEGASADDLRKIANKCDEIAEKGGGKRDGNKIHGKR